MVDEQSGDEPGDGPGWATRHFAMALDQNEVPELLRRVATEIDGISGFNLSHLAVNVCNGEATAVVYFWISAD